jgi:hypothetical protein
MASQWERLEETAQREEKKASWRRMDELSKVTSMSERAISESVHLVEECCVVQGVDIEL